MAFDSAGPKVVSPEYRAVTAYWPAAKLETTVEAIPLLPRPCTTGTWPLIRVVPA